MGWGDGEWRKSGQREIKRGWSGKCDMCDESETGVRGRIKHPERQRGCVWERVCNSVCDGGVIKPKGLMKEKGLFFILSFTHSALAKLAVTAGDPRIHAGIVPHPPPFLLSRATFSSHRKYGVCQLSGFLGKSVMNK